MPPLAVVFLVANVAILTWNVVVAVRSVQGRQGAPADRALTALAAILVAPGALVAVSATTLGSGRAIYVIEWLWPLTIGVYAAQAGHALWRGRARRWFSAPVLAMNLLLFAAAMARLATTTRPDPSPALLAFAAAHAGVLGIVFGQLSLFSPLALQAPVLVPPTATTFRTGKTWRSALGVLSAATAMAIVLEYPPSFQAIRSYEALAPRDEPAAFRADFPVGLRILPGVSAPPRALALREDLALLDSLGAGAIAVVVTPQGATGTALDSLARALRSHRRDSTVLVVFLGYDARDRRTFARDPEAYARYRLSALEEVVHRLRPEVIFPALDPHSDGARALGTVPNRWWRAYLREGSATAKRVLPRTRVGLMASSFTPPDSELFAWASQPGTALDVIGFAIRPSFGGGASLDARYRAAERWSRDVEKPLWILATGAYPRLSGERNQRLALRATLRWAARHPRVAGLLVDGSGDHEALMGLRAPGGRVRPAADVLLGLRE